MTKHLSRTILSLTMLCWFAAPCFAQDDGGDTRRPRSSRATPQPKGGSPKADMKNMNRSVRAIATFLKNPKDGAAPMDQVVELQKLAMDAKFQVPSAAAKKPENERAEFLKGYRKEITALIRLTLDLEDAMEAKNWTKASEILGSMDQLKDDGHKKYKGRGRG